LEFFTSMIFENLSYVSGYDRYLVNIYSKMEKKCRWSKTIIYKIYKLYIAFIHLHTSAHMHAHKQERMVYMYVYIYIRNKNNQYTDGLGTGDWY